MTDCVPPTNCVCVVLRPFLSLFIVVTAESGVVSTDVLFRGGLENLGSRISGVSA